MAFRAILPLVEAAESGAFTLPPAITSALAVERRAAQFASQAYTTRVRAQEHGTGIDEIATEVLDALARGAEPGSDVEQRLEDAERDRRLADLRSEVATAAQRRAVDRADTVVAGLADEIVHEHLAPALAETIEAAKKLVGIVSKFGGDVDDSGHVVRHGDAKLIAAVRELDGLVTRYNAIRRARQHLLAVLGQPAFDSDGSFAEFQRAVEAYGAAWNVRHQTREREWPAGPRARLLWIAEHAERVKPWVPTPAEQDAELAAHLRATGPQLITRGGESGIGQATPWYWQPPFNTDPAPERRRPALVVR